MLKIGPLYKKKYDILHHKKNLQNNNVLVI